MMTVLSCLFVEHNLVFVGLAALICVSGSFIAMRLFARVRRSDGGRRIAWLFLASFLAGGTIWTTHFTAMLGYQPPIAHGFGAELTFLSLIVAIAATFAGLFITASGGNSALIEAGGVVLGLGIGAMHYTGMAAYEVAGRIEWDQTLVAASLILGAAFGAIAMNRIARPVTRFCRYGSILALIIAICSLHFTGMGAVTIVPDASIVEPQLLISEGIMAVGVTSLMFLILATGLSIHFIDLQTQNEVVDRYRHLALHDPLTALPNRAFLTSRLETLTTRPADDTARLAILAFDLNRFKHVNDVHGHATGDALLREIANRLNAQLTGEEFVARIGGDEFVAVKPGVFTRTEARNFAQMLLNEVERPMELEGQTHSVGASIGISIFPDDGHDADTLVVRADLAMYRAKAGDKGSICFYEQAMDESSRSRSALAISLKQAVARNEFELFYQPQNDTATRQLVGFEALLRWKHETRGVVPPDEFIPIAEETGLICEIGEWVLREACREAARWSKPYRIAVNVAPLQLAQAALPKIVHEALLESGLEASRLELEITESGIIADQTHALHIVRQLKNLGVRIAMDDYGTGYSSLATLKSFPFDKIKIDRSFVDGVNTSPQSAAIVRATIILGSSLNIPVLAEGVETEEHLSFLTSEGCNEVQGYFFGKPMPLDDLHALVTSDAEAAAEPLPMPRSRPRAARKVA